MKNLCSIILIAISVQSHAQNTWIQKANLAGVGRHIAAGFSIGNKGYIGTGQDSGYVLLKDFWEYDALIDAWTQKADFGGDVRGGAVGFSIGNKGYIGTGFNWINYELSDFWEYDPAINMWTQKADFAGTARVYAVGFSIGSKGYIGTGTDANDDVADFWEYNPLTDVWTSKADFGGIARQKAVGFSINNKGYIVTGTDQNAMYCFYDFWEYDPVSNTWIQKADFAGQAREGAIGFSIGNEGFVGGGISYCDSSTTNLLSSDFWEYNSIGNIWIHRTNIISNTWWYLISGVGFSISGKGYVGTGHGSGYTKEFLEYTPDTVNITCSAFYFLYADTVPQNYIAVNYASGAPPITYSWSWGDGYFSSGPNPSHTYNTPGFYNICLTITDGTGCTQTFCDSSYLYRQTADAAMINVTIISAATGIEYLQEKNNSIIINPNPANATIQLTLPKNMKGNIEILNTVGETIFTENIFNVTKKEINVENISSGIYFVKVFDGERSYCKKLIIE